MGENYQISRTAKSKIAQAAEGKCSHCGLHFKPGESIEKHHLQPRAKGGSNSDKNLTLVHLHCHDQITSAHAEVTTLEGEVP